MQPHAQRTTISMCMVVYGIIQPLILYNYVCLKCGFVLNLSDLVVSVPHISNRIFSRYNAKSFLQNCSVKYVDRQCKIQQFMPFMFFMENVSKFWTAAGCRCSYCCEFLDFKIEFMPLLGIIDFLNMVFVMWNMENRYFVVRFTVNTSEELLWLQNVIKAPKCPTFSTHFHPPHNYHFPY